MLKQSRIYHHKLSKAVVDIKLDNVAHTRDGTWKIIDLGSITDPYATELSATYHFIMCTATAVAQFMPLEFTTAWNDIQAYFANGGYTD